MSMTFARSLRVLGLWLAAALLLVASAAAQQPEPPSVQPVVPGFEEEKFTGFSFFVENDSIQLGGRNEDRNYTGGFGFQFGGRFVQDAHLDAPLRVLDRVSHASRKHDAWDREFHTLLIFGSGFSPDNLNTREPVRDDRPYASLVGVSVRRLSVNDETFEEAWSSELAIAMLGLPVARNLQTWLHRRLRARSGEEVPYDPLGWHNQISDGGEPTALYRVGYERLLLGDEPSADVKHFQLTGGFAASAGYYTNFNFLLNTRVGSFNSDFWEFTPGAMNNIGAQKLSMGRGGRRWELFLFAGARPRLNIYNALLQGQFRNSVHTVEIKPGTLEWDLGLAGSFRRVQVSWNMFAGRTSEFKGGTPRTHTWGSLIVTYAVPMPEER